MAKILVVDDEENVRALISDVLSGDGHSIELAEDGAKALEKLKAAAFDLLIIDRNMPNLTGLEAIAAIRREPRWKALKILMVTSEGAMAEIDEALAAGADGYILKPFKVRRVVDQVRAVLGGPSPEQGLK